MKTILIWALVLLAGIYGIGFYSVGESGVNRFLDKSAEMTAKGDAQGLCDQLADDMTVAITDHTVEVDRRLGDGKLNGGKTELCEHLQSVSAMAAGGISMQFQRSDLKIKRQLLHPWTAEVTYTEKQAMAIQAGGQSMSIKTESDDKMLLAMTLGGVKIKRWESEAWLQ